MTIYLSASSIKDYLGCSMRYYFRRFHKNEATPSTALSIGTIVHDTLEHAWQVEDSALEYAKNHPLSEELIDKEKKVVYGHVKRFFKHFRGLVSDEDIIEQFFELPLSKGVVVRGKLDRILPGGTIIDWKTTKRPPMSIANDPQFILYKWAYQTLHKREPANVMYASLTTGKLIPLRSNPMYEDILFDEVIPEMLDAIATERFVHSGRLQYNSPCTWCQFKEFCWYELAGRNTTTTKA